MKSKILHAKIKDKTVKRDPLVLELKLDWMRKHIEEMKYMMSLKSGWRSNPRAFAIAEKFHKDFGYAATTQVTDVQTHMMKLCRRHENRLLTQSK